jgi:hypothetical protein
MSKTTAPRQTILQTRQSLHLINATTHELTIYKAYFQ